MLKRMMKIALGSEVDKNYIVESKPVATGGPHFCWKVYNAVRKATHEEVSVFIFKESYFTPEDKPYKDDFIYLLRQDVKKMTMLRHPYTLKMIEVMPENPKEICFVTERVTCSLANMCNNFTNLPAENIPSDIKEKNLSPFEVTCGIINLCDGLMFLHDTAKLVHLDLCPENIWITPDGNWKLAGFGFSLSTEAGSTRYLLDCGSVPFNRFAATPDMSYSAPELSTPPGNFTVSTDMWSLGCVIWELFSLGQESNGTTFKLVHVEDGNPTTHATIVQNLQPVSMDRIPQMLQSSLMSLLNVNPSQRASANAMKNAPYFTHGPVQTMRELDTLLEMDEEHQKEVLKDLLPALAPFPDYLLESMVLPKLEELSHISDFAPFILPCLLYIAERVKPDVFNSRLMSAFEPMMTLTSPPELVTDIYRIFLGHLELLLEKGDSQFKNKLLLPMLGRCVGCGVKSLQMPVLHSIELMVNTMDKKQIKEHLVPRIQKVVLEGSDINVRTMGVESLCSLLPIFEKAEIQSEVLNVYKKLIAADRDPSLITTVTRCYTTIGKQFGAVVIAQTILPKVTYLLAESSLERDQFVEIMNHIEDMLQVVRTQREEEFKRREEERIQKEKEQEEQAKRMPPPKPAKPESDLFEKPSLPTKPVKPEKPEKPSLPTKPVKPGEKPTLPTKPVKPSKPVGDDPFGGMAPSASGGDMFADMGSAPVASQGDMFADMGSVPSGGDMFADMGSAPVSNQSDMFADMGSAPVASTTQGDMFGEMSPLPDDNFMSGTAPSSDMFGGMDTQPAGGDMFGEMASTSVPAGGDMFGDMNPIESKPATSSNLDGMNMGGDMFGGMDSGPSGVSGMSMGGDMFGDMNPIESKPEASSNLGGMNMGGDMFGGMSSGPAGGDMFGDMNPIPESKPVTSAANLDGMNMGGDMFGGMNSAPAGMSGMNMGGDMFGDMNPIPESKPEASSNLGGMNMGGDMFGGMSSGPAGGDMFGDMNPIPESKPASSSAISGMNMGGDMFGGMDSAPSGVSGMSMGGDMFGGMSSGPAGMSGMSMGGDMFGDMNPIPESKPAMSSNLSGMSMGGDMFGGMSTISSNDMFGGMDSQPTSSGLSGMNMGGDMFGDMNSTPSGGISGMSFGSDMFSGM